MSDPLDFMLMTLDGNNNDDDDDEDFYGPQLFPTAARSFEDDAMELDGDDDTMWPYPCEPLPAIDFADRDVWDDVPSIPIPTWAYAVQDEHEEEEEEEENREEEEEQEEEEEEEEEEERPCFPEYISFAQTPDGVSFVSHSDTPTLYRLRGGNAWLRLFSHDSRTARRMRASAAGNEGVTFTLRS